MAARKCQRRVRHQRWLGVVLGRQCDWTVRTVVGTFTNTGATLAITFNGTLRARLSTMCSSRSLLNTNDCSPASGSESTKYVNDGNAGRRGPAARARDRQHHGRHQRRQRRPVFTGLTDTADLVAGWRRGFCFDANQKRQRSCDPESRRRQLQRRRSDAGARPWAKLRGFSVDQGRCCFPGGKRRGGRDRTVGTVTNAGGNASRSLSKCGMRPARWSNSVLPAKSPISNAATTPTGDGGKIHYTLKWMEIRARQGPGGASIGSGDNHGQHHGA